MLVIGTEEYLDHVLGIHMPMKLIKAYPNPFKGRISIQYRIPVGIKEVNFTLYNLYGQKLWQGIERQNVKPGEHIFSFDGSTHFKNDGLPAGVYIIRMKAKNFEGKTIYGGKRKVTCLK